MNFVFSTMKLPLRNRPILNLLSSRGSALELQRFGIMLKFDLDAFKSAAKEHKSAQKASKKSKSSKKRNSNEDVVVDDKPVNDVDIDDDDEDVLF
jgi:hypothetical protein